MKYTGISRVFRIHILDAKFSLLLAAILVAADQITKSLAVKHLIPITTKSVINGFFSLTYAENTGAAFGLLENGRVFFIILTLIILTGICYYYVKLPKDGIYKPMRLMLILIAAGAAGNFIDRVKQGYVVDFFHFTFIDFPIFNCADIYLVTGTIVLAVILIFFVKSETE